MSAVGRSADPAESAANIPTATSPPERMIAASRAIGDPPNPAAGVVGDEQRAVRQHQQADGSTPARAVRELPAGDEVLDGDRLAVLDTHPDHLRARWHAAVPGAVVGHEGVAAIASGEHRAGVKGEAEWRRVRLYEEGGRLDSGALGFRVFGVGLVGQVTLRPAVELAVLQDVEVLRWQIVPEVIAVVVIGPELAGRRVERDADGVAQPRRKQVLPGAVEIV